MDTLHQIFQYLLNLPYWVLLAWAFVVIVALLILIKRPKRVLISSSDSGQLQISQHALHRLIEACCEQINGVATARVHVSGPAGKFRTQIKLKVRPNAKVDAIHGYLTQEVTNIYQQNLGIDNEGQVEIEVTGIVAEEKSFG